MMPGSDSEDSGFGDDLALPSTQAAQQRRACQRQEDADQGRNRVAGCRPRGRCELGASRWSAWDTRRGLSSDLAAWLRRSIAALRPSQFAKLLE